jgi:hypothetical protein
MDFTRRSYLRVTPTRMTVTQRLAEWLRRFR